MSYLVFENKGTSESGKTKRWVVKSTSGIILGWIEWFARWRQYTFSPMSGTTFSSGCADDISTFLKKAMAEHKCGPS